MINIERWFTIFHDVQIKNPIWFALLGSVAGVVACIIAHHPITMDVPNIPVRVDGVLYDYRALMNIPVGEGGARLNPMSRRTFYPDQIQADRMVNGRVQKIITDHSTLTVGMGT